MKTIEEKTRAYDKALEKAKELMKKGYYVLMPELFPELAESKDERIRKYLIGLLNTAKAECRNEREYDQAEKGIAWLEKQKPAEWSEEDKDMLFNIIQDYQDKINNTIPTDNLCEYYKKAINWLKSLRPQPKQEWSEEDEKILETLTLLVRDYNWKRITCGFVGANKNDVLSWLKSLRPQKQCGYNPYKAVVESIAEMCRHYDKASHSALRDFYDNVKVKCKDAKEYDSMFPQKQWKPSEEQMKALKLAYEDAFEVPESCVPHLPLKSLYNDLKQL